MKRYKNRIDGRRGQCWIENNICQIPLKDGTIALCDEDRMDKVNLYTWYSHKSTGGYPAAYVDGNKCMHLHRFLYPEAKEHLDHINGNILDNRSCNLRFATNRENSRNANKRHDNTTGYKGVVRAKNGFECRIGYNYKRYFLGYFKNAEEAAHAYDAKAKELHGEFARLNFPE